jgi:hypothetical protein
MIEDYYKYTGPARAEKAFNSLRGIVTGIVSDNVVDQVEIAELDGWIALHHDLLHRQPFKEVVDSVKYMLHAGVIAQDDVDDLLWVFDKFQGEYDYYDIQTADMQILQGMCHGILSDGEVSDDEIISLKTWLADHRNLSSFYPYDEIHTILTKVLEDGIIDEDERLQITAILSEFVAVTDSCIKSSLQAKIKSIQVDTVCATNPNIDLKDRKFVLTGSFNRGTKADIQTAIEIAGGAVIKNVTKAANYLVVGGAGNPCWTYACYGRKVEKAMKMRKAGHTVTIVTESDLWGRFDDGI